MNSGSICKRDMWTSHGMSHCPMGPWDGMDSGTHTHLYRDRWTSHGMSHCPMGLWDAMDNPLSDGTMGWDGQWDIHASVEGQVDIPWNVPLSHGTVGWDGQFTAFLDIYVIFFPISLPYSHKKEGLIIQS